MPDEINMADSAGVGGIHLEGEFPVGQIAPIDGISEAGSGRSIILGEPQHVRIGAAASGGMRPGAHLQVVCSSPIEKIAQVRVSANGKDLVVVFGEDGITVAIQKK